MRSFWARGKMIQFDTSNLPVMQDVVTRLRYEAATAERRSFFDMSFSCEMHESVFRRNLGGINFTFVLIV